VGLIRKALAVSTLGGVKYTSRREAETKLHLANAQLVQAQARREAADAEAADAEAAKWEPIVQAVEAGEAIWNDLPRLQRLAMPPKYSFRCLVAERRRTSAPGQHRATSNGDHNG
jgi:hypothetical protein